MVRKINILANAIVANTDMIKNYKTCREKAEVFGKIFILKNNQPDAVLFSHDEYDRISKLIEYLEDFDNSEVESIVETLSKVGFRRKHLVDELQEDLKC
ncbi:MAG: hypothetical protein JJE17_01650 [Peptostreptococcaceae bacterium]|nr:hypothetical protein [Peptostreptococcaceae bacterium]